MHGYGFQALISVRRLSNFLCCPEYGLQLCGNSDENFDGDDSLLTEPQLGLNHKDKVVIFRDVKCAWSSESQEVKNLVLHSINLGIPRGFLVAVIGEVSIFSNEFVIVLFPLKDWVNKTWLICLTCKQKFLSISFFIYNFQFVSFFNCFVVFNCWNCTFFRIV